MNVSDNLYIFTIPPSTSDIVQLRRRRDSLISSVDFIDEDDLILCMSQLKFINLLLGLYDL